MRLNRRITIMVVVAATAICTLLATVMWWRDQELGVRYRESLLHTQNLAWTKLESDSLDTAQKTLASLLAQPAWTRAWQRRDRVAMAQVLREALNNDSRWRADAFDMRRELLYSTSADLRQEPLVEAGWISRATQSGEVQRGLSQVSRDRYFVVVAQRFGGDRDGGVLAIGVDIAVLLPRLSTALAGDAFILNLRGREVAGTVPGLLGREGVTLPVHTAGANRLSLRDGSDILAVFQPLTGPDRRAIASLLLMRDVTQQSRADFKVLASVALATVLVLIGLGTAMFFYLRQTFRPLERAVRVLGALSQGDLRTALDEEDQALPGEAGQIARGVEALRTEMLNLQMLRDERTRTRQQQERLIRAQLKQLAESIDESSRAEILAELEPDGGRKDPAANDLAELASILGRMSSLVTTQQDRLVKLLKDLRAAMEHQATLVSLQQELEIARNIQLSILPQATPDTPEVEVAALMIPAKEIGGDFYDYFLVDAEHLAVVVADVSGKGIPAAFFMAISRTLLKSSVLFLREPALVMTRLNEQLCAENEQMMFVTAFLGVLHLPTGTLTFVNAGHNPPLVRHVNGDVTVLPKSQNTALAVMEDLVYVQGSCTLSSGDTLLLYTDGVTEATDAQNQLFGEERLLQTVRAEHSEGVPLPEVVLAAVRAFEDGAAQADDITCVSLRYTGAAAEAPR
jgi:phosphoserine phosphatase RsbU/P